MAHAQMLVLSSNHEGLSNVLIAAMSYGTPVVSSNGQHDKLTPLGDDLALSKAILETLDHPLPKKQLREPAVFLSILRWNNILSY